MLFRLAFSIVIAVSLFGAIVSAGALLSAAEPPASLLDLTAWKLTLPYNTERKGDPDEVVQPVLAKFQDPTSFYLSDLGDAVIFRAACGGLGTKNSKYPRSELREMQADGKEEAFWATDDGGTHVMEMELAITHTPEVRQHVVCAQIHDKKDDLMMVRLEKNKLIIERNKLDDVPLDSNYRVGDKFKLRLTSGDGHIKVSYNGEQKMDWEVSTKQCYFKAGCYTQSNVTKGDQADAYGEVAIFRLQVTHSK